MLEQPILGVVMDPIEKIHPEKDTTLALLLAAKKRGFKLHYFELSDLFLQYGNAWGLSRTIDLNPSQEPYYHLSEPILGPLDQFDVLLMRKDPPVDMQYLYATYILEHAEQNGCLVLNKPKALRDANEKLFATWFPQCMPPTLVSASRTILKTFIEEQGVVVLKPLDGMGGRNIFQVAMGDPNLNSIIEFLTHQETNYIMAQRYIPEITAGDKRILLINGEPIPFGLARIPAADDFRGNLAAGGTGIGVELSKRDLWICAQIGPILREKGLTFVGIDVIGDYLTEINVTSPTCVRELETIFDIDIADKVIAAIMDKLED